MLSHTMHTRTHLLIPALALLLFSGCATTKNVQQVAVLESEVGQPRILLMPPDIRYYLVTAGGVPEPHAAWTEAARENFSGAVQHLARDNSTELSLLGDNDLTARDIEYIKLHEAVGTMAMVHHFGTTKLPSKEKAFDWSLGPGVLKLAEEHDADYALFVFYRDEQASGGRVAMAVLAAAVGGYVSTGGEYGFASLVDLRSGDIVWFNIVGAGSGELRDADGAQAAVNTLFKNFPAGRSQ
jgi:hypothetical protein